MVNEHVLSQETIRKERVKRIASQRSMRLAEQRESNAATAATSADTEKKSTEADGQLETKKDETTDHTDDKESKTEATAAAATAAAPITVETAAETEQKAENENDETKKDDAPSTPMPAPAVPVETPTAAKETNTPTPAPASSSAADQGTKTETAAADDLMPPDFRPESEDIPDHNFRVGDCVQCRYCLHGAGKKIISIRCRWKSWTNGEGSICPNHIILHNNIRTSAPIFSTGGGRVS